jgi:hypothetical protein
METIKREICEYKLLKSEIVFVDGLTRVGKSMLNTIIASLEKVSHPQFIEPLEQLLPMYKTGHIDRNATSAFLRLYLNEKFYNYSLSRNLNFRYDDLTSVHNSTSSTDFFKNLSLSDGDEIIDNLENDNIIHQYQTHDILTHYELFSGLNIEVQIIELLRNPIDTIYSWYDRGWGNRFDNEDARSFTSLFKYENKTLPHYAIGYEDEYFTLNEMEKCVFLHNILLKRSLEEYRKLTDNQKNNILLIKYEDILEEPNKEIDKICTFLQTTKSECTEKAFKNARVPRVIKIEEREKKVNEIKGNIKQELFDDLNNLVNQYEENLYGLGK